jgi:hypothetical protein
VIIKEPNKQTRFDGAIYFLLESAEKEKKSLLSFFTYKSDSLEPRLFVLSYSRGLHEQIEKQMRGKLQRGQPVLGRLSEIKKGTGKRGTQKGADGKGDGSESQRQGWEFHTLRPSYFLKKPEQ